MKFLYALFFILVCNNVFAGEANINKNITLDVSFSKISKFIEENQTTFGSTIGLKIIKKKGSVVRVRKVTRKGTFEFTVKESLKKTPASISYRSKLVESHKGNIEAMDASISVVKAGTRSTVNISIHTKVNDPSINDPDVRIDINRSIRKVQIMLENETI